MPCIPKHLYVVKALYSIGMYEENQKVLDLGHALILHRELAPKESESIHVCFSSEILFVEFIARHKFPSRPVSKQVGSSLCKSFSKTASVYRIQGKDVLKAVIDFCESVSRGLRKVEVRKL